MLLLAGLACGGCYRYVPIPLAQLEARENIRVRVTDSAAVRIVQQFGTYTTQLEGEVAREGTDSVSVSVTIARDYRGLALESARQTLFLGRAEVVELRRRELSRARTVLVSAGAVAVFGILIRTIIQMGDSNPDGQEPLPPPPPPGYRGVLLRVSIP